MPATDIAERAPERMQHLTFMLRNEAYAIGILAIKEIIEYDGVTVVPMMPAHVRGVINLRGSVVPVVDLSVRFGREATPVGRRSCVVIVEVAADGATQDIGVIVDAVNEVIEIPPGAIAPPPAFGASIRSGFLAGMGRLGDRFVMLLDVSAVLSIDDMAALAA